MCSLCVCVFVHIIMCVCVCVLVCVCSCMQACVCVSVFMHASMCVCVCMCVHAPLLVYLLIPVCAAHIRKGMGREWLLGDCACRGYGNVYNCKPVR